MRLGPLPPFALADYCAEGSAAPLPCPGGTTMDASLEVMTSAEQCLTCPVGTFCPVGSATASLCAPGTPAAARLLAGGYAEVRFWMNCGANCHEFQATFG